MGLRNMYQLITSDNPIPSKMRNLDLLYWRKFLSLVELFLICDKGDIRYLTSKCLTSTNWALRNFIEFPREPNCISSRVVRNYLLNSDDISNPICPVVHCGHKTTISLLSVATLDLSL